MRPCCWSQSLNRSTNELNLFCIKAVVQQRERAKRRRTPSSNCRSVSEDGCQIKRNISMCLLHVYRRWCDYGSLLRSRKGIGHSWAFMRSRTMQTARRFETVKVYKTDHVHVWSIFAVFSNFSVLKWLLKNWRHVCVEDGYSSCLSTCVCTLLCAVVAQSSHHFALTLRCLCLSFRICIIIFFIYFT